MKKNYKNIKEQTERIKSLFSEERLFGNLVEQTDAECATQLQTKGYIVTKPTDIDNQFMMRKLSGCLKLRDGNPTTLGKLWQFIEPIMGNDINVEVDGNTENCKLIFSPKTSCVSDRMWSEDRVIMSIYGGGVFSTQFNFQILYQFGTNSSSTFKGVKYIKPGVSVPIPLTYLRYEGQVDLVLDSNNTVTNVTYNIPLTVNNAYTIGNQPASVVDAAEKFTSYSTDGTNDATKSFTFNQFLPKMRPEITASGDLKDLLQDDVMECKRNDTSTLKRVNL
jgi:hypothetical protein